MKKHLLAHLSRRPTRWAYSIPIIRRPSVVVVIHTFKLEYLRSQLVSLDQSLCVASQGVEKGCSMFWGWLDQNCGVHGNRKPALTYNEENGVSTFSRLLFDPILFIFAGNEDVHKISDEFEFRPDRTTDYGVSCLSKKIPIDL